MIKNVIPAATPYKLRVKKKGRDPDERHHYREYIFHGDSITAEDYKKYKDVVFYLPPPKQQAVL